MRGLLLGLLVALSAGSAVGQGELDSYFPGGYPTTCGASCTVAVDSAAGLAAAMRNQSVEAVVLLADVAVGAEHFGAGEGRAVTLERDLMLHGAAPGAAVTLSFELSGTSEARPWLRLARGQLLLSNLRTGPGLVELGHPSGHMPVTLVGVDLYGRDPASGEYCQCTQLGVMDSLLDVTVRGGQPLRGGTPAEQMQLLVRDQLFLGETLRMNSVFSRDRWSFLDFDEAVFPQGMAFRMRNATLLFPEAPPRPPMEEAAMRTDCQSSMTPGLRGRDYNGSVAVTRSGVPCAYWQNVQIPGLDLGDLRGNACRNPGDHSGAWCFVRLWHRQLALDTYIPNFPFKWEYCDIPSCEERDNATTSSCQNLTDNGAMYTGNVSVAHTGLECEPWTRTYPALYGNIEGNSCRNPYGSEDFVGCFVQGRWSRCPVEACAPPKVPVSPSGSPAPPAAPTAEPRGTDVTAVAVGVTVAALVIAAAGLIARALLKRRELRIATDSVVTVDATAPTEGTRLNRKLSRQESTASSTVASSVTVPQSLASSELRVRLQQNDLMEDTIVLSSPIDMGHITLKRRLGSGSFAKVWQASWLGADAAVKVMNIKGRTAQLRAHLLKGVEATSLRGITHPNVVQTYHVYKVVDRSFPEDPSDADEIDENGHQVPNIAELWVVQELCNKGDLRASLDMLCPLKQGSVKILCTTLKEVVLALSYLHHLGIVHGDLKCENVLLKSSTSEHGLIAKVADFGLSRDLRGLDSYYATNISGDMKYLAPEVLEHNRISPKIDTYSLGFLIYELCTGDRASMDHLTLATHVQEVVHQRKRPTFPDTVVLELKSLAEDCWDHDPEQRPCDQSILKRLDEVLVKYSSPQKSTFSIKSFKDMTANFNTMLTSGQADGTEIDGYLVPELGPAVAASLVDPKLDVRLEI